MAILGHAEARWPHVDLSFDLVEHFQQAPALPAPIERIDWLYDGHFGVLSKPASHL